MIPVLTALCLAGSPCVIDDVRVEVGDGTVLPSATVVIEHGRITSVGSGKGPAGARHLDGKGKVLTPGLVESRTQLGLVEIGLEPSTVDHTLQGVPVAPGFRAADGFNSASVHIPITREEGVTSAITQPLGSLLYGTGVWFDLTGRPASAPDPTRPTAMFGGLGKGAAKAHGGARGGTWLRLREVIADARFYGKNRAAVDRNAARTLSLSPLQLEALLPVLEGRLPLVLDVNRASDIRAALALAKAERLRLVIAGGAEAWLVADELAAAKVPVILQPTGQDPGSFDRLHARDDAPALLHRAGVPLILSAASWDQNARRLRQEAGIAVAHGLPREAALRAITLAPAEAFGMAGQLGTVAKGKRANLVLWSGDPLELSTVAERVLIDGEELPPAGRQRALVERYLAR